MGIEAERMAVFPDADVSANFREIAQEIRRMKRQNFLPLYLKFHGLFPYLKLE